MGNKKEKLYGFSTSLFAIHNFSDEFNNPMKRESFRCREEKLRGSEGVNSSTKKKEGKSIRQDALRWRGSGVEPGSPVGGTPLHPTCP